MGRLRVLIGVVAAAFLAVAVVLPAHAERVRDLAAVEGLRGNQLIGYGLVVGLAGTGDQTTQIPYSVQTIKNLLRNMGVVLPSRAFMEPNAVAAVMVTANLKSFEHVGQQISVTVSAVGNAKSLRGGVLLMTELRGADGRVYAVAQGSVLVSGFAAGGAAAKTKFNTPTVGRIPQGATVERSVAGHYTRHGVITLNLESPSFGNAARIVHAINAAFGTDVARAPGPGRVVVRGPGIRSDRVAFVARILNVPVTPIQGAATITVDAQSGAVVIGRNVTIGPAAVAYGGLSVTVSETPEVSQPSPFSKKGKTVVVPRTQVKAKEKKLKVVQLRNAPRISDIVRDLNAIGASASDLIGILDALHSAGALHARIKVI